MFRPYAGVSTAILIFTKTNSGGTDHVWFYDVEADGWSLDDKRNALLSDAKLGPNHKPEPLDIPSLGRREHNLMLNGAYRTKQISTELDLRFSIARKPAFTEV